MALQKLDRYDQLFKPTILLNFKFNEMTPENKEHDVLSVRLLNPEFRSFVFQKEKSEVGEEESGLLLRVFLESKFEVLGWCQTERPSFIHVTLTDQLWMNASHTHTRTHTHTHTQCES